MKLFSGKIFTKSSTSEGNSEPRLYSEVSWISNFKISRYGGDKSLQDWSSGKQLILFPSNLNLSLCWDSRESKLTVSLGTRDLSHTGHSATLVLASNLGALSKAMEKRPGDETASRPNLKRT